MEKQKNNYQTTEINMKKLGFVPKQIGCSRCSGSGRLPQYNHIEGGICFKCRGEKYYTVYIKVA